MKLVLVESPAKCAKIMEYLGKEYQCMATMGHIRILPDLAHLSVENMQPTYQDKEGAPIAKLKTAISRATKVYLATDDDREGEAIAFHLCDRFGLPIDTTPRIVFHEITPTAVRTAVNTPGHLRMPIVRAQQARQILDVMIGFRVSPFLWSELTQFSRDGLSAGRCQSPTLRLVGDHAEEQLAARSSLPKTTEEFDWIGIFPPSSLTFSVPGRFSSSRIQEIFAISPTFPHTWLSPTERQLRNLPAPPPFTTCLFQQAMSNELHLSPKDSMIAAQELYEAGWITYMRTDGTHYSADFWAQLSSIGKPLAPQITGEVGAHEAIRVVTVAVRTLAGKGVSMNAQRVYQKIWHRCVESCMNPAILEYCSLRIQAPQGNVYLYLCERRVEEGWLAFTPLTKKEEERALVFRNQAQFPHEGTEVRYECLEARQQFSDLPLPHYTEARVVSLLKEKGIGRPSTYASLLEKNLQRKYMEKKNIPGKIVPKITYRLFAGSALETEITQQKIGEEKNKLLVTPLGKMVLSCLYPKMDALIGYEYTQRMEADLDAIAQGQLEWKTLCWEVWKMLGELLPDPKAVGVGEKKTYSVEGGKFQYMMGKYGPVLRTGKGKSAAFVPVRITAIDMGKLERGEYTFAELTTPDSTTETPDRRELTPYLSIRKGKYGFYLFYQTPSMKKAQFYKISNYPLRRGESYLECELAPLLGWIHQEYGLPAVATASRGG